jgi:hypothetical protein
LSSAVIDVVDSFGVHVSGTIGRHTFVTVYAGRARTADISAHRAALEKFVDARRTPVPVLTVVGQGSTIGKRGRQEISRMLGDLDEDVRAWAVVMEGAGFWLSAARVIAGGVRLVSGSNCPFKVASSVPEALQWLTEQTGESYPGTLTTEVHALEQEIRQRTAAAPA